MLDCSRKSSPLQSYSSVSSISGIPQQNLASGDITVNSYSTGRDIRGKPEDELAQPLFVEIREVAQDITRRCSSTLCSCAAIYILA